MMSKQPLDMVAGTVGEGPDRRVSLDELLDELLAQSTGHHLCPSLPSQPHGVLSSLDRPRSAAIASPSEATSSTSSRPFGYIFPTTSVKVYKGLLYQNLELLFLE